MSRMIRRPEFHRARSSLTCTDTSRMSPNWPVYSICTHKHSASASIKDGQLMLPSLLNQAKAFGTAITLICYKSRSGLLTPLRHASSKSLVQFNLYHITKESKMKTLLAIALVAVSAIASAQQYQAPRPYTSPSVKNLTPEWAPPQYTPPPSPQQFQIQGSQNTSPSYTGTLYPNGDVTIQPNMVGGSTPQRITPNW
jgi:hypothetical protein